MPGVTPEIIARVISTVRRSKYRPKDERGKPGGLIELPPTMIPIIVGDLHSCLPNLVEILEHNDNEKRIRKGEAILVLLGDTVHNDQTGALREMATSLETLEYIFGLFVKHGSRIVYLRGNHDSFDENLVKSGIRQGLEFRNHVAKERGEEYLAQADSFFENLPVFAIGKGFAITHAGPVRGGSSRDDLVNIYRDRNQYWQLIWNRINEFGGTSSMKEYDGSDVRATRKKLGLAENAPFIVGHNPLWNTGNRTGVWQNVLGIEGHHILYSGAQTRAPYMTFEGGELAVQFAIATEREALYV